MKNRIYLFVFYIASFFFSVHLATTSYINSSFLENIIPSINVGIFYAVASFATLIILFFLPSILRRYGNQTFSLGLIFLSMLSLSVFVFSDSNQLKAFFFCVYLLTNTAIIFSFDIFLEHFSKNKKTGTQRGLYLTLTNWAWILSPLIAGVLVDKYGFDGLYSYAVFALIPTFFLILFRFNSYKDKEYQHIRIRDSISIFFAKKDLALIWFCNFILQFFYAWMVIYTPIFLHDSFGFSYKEIGIIFTIMLLPFVLIEYPFGRLADKKYGEKEFLGLGFTIASITTFFIYIIDSHKLWVWAIILFATRIGASLIEIMVETYLFKKTTEKDSAFISIYRGSVPFAYFIAPIVAFILMQYANMPLAGMFPVLSLVLMVGFVASLFIKDTK